MAGGDYGATSSVTGHQVEADDRRRRGPVTQVSRHLVSCSYLGYGGREVLRREARVVPDDKPPGSQALIDQQVGCPLGTEADVLEGVVLTDDGAPAVRAESYRHLLALMGAPHGQR